jgi:hypothetical protein
MDGSARDLHEVSGRGVDLALAQRDLESAFEKVETLFLAMVNVQRRPASGRDDPFHDEIGSVVLGAGDQEGVTVARSPVRRTCVGWLMKCEVLIFHLVFSLSGPLNRAPERVRASMIISNAPKASVKNRSTEAYSIH